MYSKELFSHLKDRYFLEQLQKFKSFFAVGFPPGYGKKKKKKKRGIGGKSFTCFVES